MYGFKVCRKTYELKLWQDKLYSLAMVFWMKASQTISITNHTNINVFITLCLPIRQNSNMFLSHEHYAHLPKTELLRWTLDTLPGLESVHSFYSPCNMPTSTTSIYMNIQSFERIDLHIFKLYHLTAYITPLI